MKRLRNRRVVVINAIALSALLMLDTLYSTAAFALTGGPSQPEVAGFMPISTSDLVNLSTGDFNFNLPLLDVGGYPINMSYSSGVSMDQEASWVGLGWNLNPGVLNRAVRGLPDDFNGQNVTTEFNMKDNVTVGLNLGAGLGAFGFEAGDLGFEGGVNGSVGVKYNNYNGIGFSKSLGVTVDMGVGSSGTNNDSSLGVGLNLTASDGGLDANASASFSSKKDRSKGQSRNVGANVGIGFNSRAGMGQLTASVSGSVTDYDILKFPFFFRTFSVRGGAKGGGSGSVGTSMSLTPMTYTPTVDAGRYNLAATFSSKLGPDFFGGDIQGNITAYYTHNKVKDKHRETPSFGYLHAHEGGSSGQHDFNRENDGAFSKNVLNLPVTNQTYDLFSANGQGVSGTYRAFRNDVGAVHDARTESNGDDGSLGGEFGAGMLAKGGFDLKFNDSRSYSALWSNENQALSRLRFESINGDTEQDKLFEPAYFRQVGELAVDPEMRIEGANDTYFESIGGFNPVRVDLSSTGTAMSQFKIDHENGGTIDFPSSSVRFKQRARKNRNQLFSYLTVEESAIHGVRTSNLPSIVYDGNGIDPNYSDQIGEVSVLQSDGSRYVYGLPLYNTFQKEVTFNASGLSASSVQCDEGLISYTSTDASINNKNGLDHYYESSSTPPFAHSFMITEVLSPDYSDNDAILGPSAGDYGNYTLFDYRTIDGFNWRSPYTDANFNEGFKSDSGDDKANYIYGEKSLSYLKSIKTKTHIAFFEFSSRHDAHEAAGEHASGSQVGVNTMQKLNEIRLYSLPEYEKAIEENVDPTPIKTVHFEYDYELGSTGSQLKNNDNGADLANNEQANQGGKLTLKKVYYTYGNSNKGRYSSYEFDYTNNKAYHPKAYDAWGNYTEPKMNSICQGGEEPSTTEFPYTTQNNEDANDFAQAWHLNQIRLPSGGTIDIEYEADDYLYVQNKRAMQMFRVMGSSPTMQSPNNISAFNNKLYSISGPNLYTLIRSEESLSTAEWQRAIQGFNTANADPVQFKFLADISNDGSYEYVPGYARLGTEFQSNGNYAVVKFLGVERENKDNGSGNNNPISKAAWNFARKFLPKKAYNMPDPQNDGQLEAVVDAIASANILNQLVSVMTGPNGRIKAELKGRKYQKGRSWIRLNLPKNKKFGGGSRVKSITSTDNWSQMTNSSAFSSRYGQEYNYETSDEYSSGVASFEPLMAKDNPWVQPIDYNNPNKYSIPNYIERPLGVSFFPSPNVTYSKVTVNDIVYDEQGVLIQDELQTNRTGHTVHEFYTTKDFPTKTRWTDLEPIEKKSGIIGNLLKLNVENFMTTSQGYAIEINDMDGKPKSTKVFGSGQATPISGVGYVYGLSQENEVAADVDSDPFESEDIPEFSLNNSVKVINRDGTIEDSEVGIEVDFVSDFREQENSDFSNGIGTNLAAFLAGIFPAMVPMAFPSASQSTTRFRSAVTTKVIHRRGILRETIAYDNGAQVSTKNLAYDANTGQVLLTETQNEFNDNIYNLNLPAYWAYPEIGQASQNINYKTTISTNSNGLISDPDDPDDPNFEVFLNYGDEVSTDEGKKWVWSHNGGDDKFLIDRFGVKLQNYNGEVKVLKSGFTNQHQTSMASMTLMKNPLLEYDANGDETGALASDLVISSDYDIVDVSAIEYSDKWKTFVAEDLDLIFEDLYSDLGNELKDWINHLIADPNNSWPQETVDLSDPYYAGFNNFYQASSCGASLTDCTTLGLDNIQYDISTSYALFRFTCSESLDCPHCGMAIQADQSLELLESVDFLQSLPFDGIFGGTTYALFEAQYSNNTTGYVKVLRADCYNLGDFMDPPPIVDKCQPMIGDPINPFVQNVRGQFRPINSYAYLGSRNYTFDPDAEVSQTNIREDGTYSNYNDYWTYNATEEKWIPSANTSEWTWTSSITDFSPYGPEVENINALHQYSSAVFGYNNTLPIAVAANSSYHQLAYDGFEDYDYYDNDGVCFKRHFAFEDYSDSRSQEHAHTGQWSIKVNVEDGVPVISERVLDTEPADDLSITNPDPTDFINPYHLRAEDALGLFGPEVYDPGTIYDPSMTPVIIDQTYVLSYWVKETSLNGDALYEYNTNKVDVHIDGTTLVHENEKTSDIIDGWQRIEYEFTISANNVGNFGDEVSIQVILQSLGGNNIDNIYFDDIRIHPKDGSMKSYVYHPENLRLVAELDDNNFATFYEYDEEGRLLRIKKETERGIMTIQESRTHTQIPE